MTSDSLSFHMEQESLQLVIYAKNGSMYDRSVVSIDLFMPLFCSSGSDRFFAHIAIFFFRLCTSFYLLCFGKWVIDLATFASHFCVKKFLSSFSHPAGDLYFSLITWLHCSDGRIYRWIDVQMDTWSKSDQPLKLHGFSRSLNVYCLDLWYAIR